MRDIVIMYLLSMRIIEHNARPRSKYIYIYIYPAKISIKHDQLLGLLRSPIIPLPKSASRGPGNEAITHHDLLERYFWVISEAP